jgi:hypothetical protein
MIFSRRGRLKIGRGVEARLCGVPEIDLNRFRRP